VHDFLPDAAGSRRRNFGGHPRRGTSGLNLGVVASLVLAFSGGASAAPTTYTVVIEQMRFNPPELTVRRGDHVTWVNKDLFPHTASANSKAFDSRSIAPDASWTYVVGQPGTYPYRCDLHPTMGGILTVR
jgi:plastocyanin